MKKLFFIFLILGLSVSAFSQAKIRKPAKKTVKTQPIVRSETETTSTTVESSETKAPQKKNSRAEEVSPETTITETKAPQKKNQPAKSNAASSQVKTAEQKYNYYYEFWQKDFLVRRVIIEHDENGKGKITFEKKDFDEPVSDPIQLSSASLEKIKSLFQTLNFVDSTEVFQSTERDYPHLGTMKIRRRSAEGKERAIEFNWTENKDARALTDEYKKIGYQYVWQFDMTVARENQPLEAPGLMDLLESYLKRNEISDPPQMIPLLKELSNEERIPLMARNKATRIIKQIEKQK